MDGNSSIYTDIENADKLIQGDSNTGFTMNNTSTTWSGGNYVKYTSRPTNTSVLYCIKYEPTYFMNYTQTISLEEADAIKKQNELLKQKNALLEQEITQLGSIIDFINKEVV